MNSAVFDKGGIVETGKELFRWRSPISWKGTGITNSSNFWNQTIFANTRINKTSADVHNSPLPHPSIHLHSCP